MRTTLSTRWVTSWSRGTRLATFAITTPSATTHWATGKPPTCTTFASSSRTTATSSSLGWAGHVVLATADRHAEHNLIHFRVSLLFGFISVSMLTAIEFSTCLYSWEVKHLFSLSSVVFVWSRSLFVLNTTLHYKLLFFFLPQTTTNSTIHGCHWDSVYEIYLTALSPGGRSEQFKQTITLGKYK